MKQESPTTRFPDLKEAPTSRAAGPSASRFGRGCMMAPRLEISDMPDRPDGFDCAPGRVAGKAISRLSILLMRQERRDYLFGLRYKER